MNKEYRASREIDGKGRTIWNPQRLTQVVDA